MEHVITLRIPKKDLYKDIKTTTSEVRNGLDEINSRLDIAMENVSEFEDTAVKTIHNETELIF